MRDQNSSVALDRGTFVISIDTEMAWGVVHRGDPLRHYRYSNDAGVTERDVIASLLRLFARYDIGATWAVVGHLFLDSCQLGNGLKHPEIQRPRYEWFSGDWFDDDPCTNAVSHPMWYGKDIAEMIQSCTTPQEIGSHTFSHIVVGDPGCDVDAFASDLTACRAIAAEHGIDLVSFVYPRNSIGHLDVLRAHGFRAYRGKRPRPFENSPVPLRPFLRAVDRVSPRRGSVVLPESVEGLWNIPSTNLYSPAKRGARRVPLSLWTRRQVARLRQAVGARGLFHLWFHSHNLLPDPDGSLRNLETILKAAARWRDRGFLDTPTMGELARRLDEST